MKSDFWIRSPQRHLSAISGSGELLKIYLSTCLGTSPDRPGENFDAHPLRPTPPTTELLQSLQEKDRNSAQQKAECLFYGLCEETRELYISNYIYMKISKNQNNEI